MWSRKMLDGGLTRPRPWRETSYYPYIRPIPANTGSLPPIIHSPLSNPGDHSTGPSSETLYSYDPLSRSAISSAYVFGRHSPHLVLTSSLLSPLYYIYPRQLVSLLSAPSTRFARSTLIKQLFPGLIYRMMKPKVVLLIFVSGKIVLTGAKVREEIYMAFNQIYSVLVGTSLPLSSFPSLPPLLLPLTYPHTLPCPPPLLHSVAFRLLSIPILNFH